MPTQSGHASQGHAPGISYGRHKSKARAKLGDSVLIKTAPENGERSR